MNMTKTYTFAARPTHGCLKARAGDIEAAAALARGHGHGPVVSVGRNVTGPARPRRAAAPPVVAELSVDAGFAYGNGGGIYNTSGQPVRCRAGEMVAVIGRSGGGKTSLLRLLAGEKRTHCGEVRLHHHGVRLLPGDAMPPFLTVRRLVRLRAELNGLRGLPCRLAVEKAVAISGVEAAWMDRLPAELSSGQRMRVALAMFLAPMPKLILADEIDAHLDPAASAEIYRHLRVVADDGVTVVFVSHSVLPVLGHVDRVIAVSDGRITSQLSGFRQWPAAERARWVERHYEA